MSPTLISPQVFVQEIDMTLYNQGNTGPIGALALRYSYKGREKDTIMVQSENEFVSKFGKPNDDNYIDTFTAIAFLKDTNQLYCTRVLPVSATFAGTMATSGASASFVPFTYENAPILATSGVGTNVEDPDEYQDSDHAAAGFVGVMNIISKDRGHCGNFLRVAICDKTAHDAIRSKTHEYTGWDTYSAIYNIDSPLDSGKEFLLVVQECKQGTSITDETNWSTVEWWNVSTSEMKRDDLGRNMYVESIVNTYSNYIRVAFNDSLNDTDITTIRVASSEWQQLDGGRINNTALTFAAAGVVGAGEMTDALINAAYNLCSNAETTFMDMIIDGDKPDAVKSYIIDLATARKDCVSIMDCPQSDVVNQSGLEEDNLREWITNLHTSYPDTKSSYAAVYGNWLDIYDKYNSKYRWVPTSGYVASAYAKCQRDYEYWDSPAGLNRGQILGVRRLAWNPSLTQRDGIYKYNINPIVSFAGQGKVIYGQKTMLDKYSAFSRLNVRRLFISVESDIGAIARNYLFEPNVESTRNAFVADVVPILDYARANDGIDAYRVVCDATNNSEDRIMRNELWMDIFIKPVFTAEFIVITFVATKSTTDFTEAVVSTTTTATF